MPTITLDGPKIEDINIKRSLVKEITDAAVKAYRLPVQAIVVCIKENPPENVGVGGELVIDKYNQ